MHVSPTSAVKQRTMTCKLYREASVFKNARNEDRKTYNNIYCKPDISGTLTWTALWGKKWGKKNDKKKKQLGFGCCYSIILSKSFWRFHERNSGFQNDPVDKCTSIRFSIL